MRKLKSLYHSKYGHALAFLYLLIYFPCFFLLESIVVDNYTSICCFLDDFIPFCEVFIIPYVLWYLFMVVTMLYLFFTSRTECLKYCTLMFGGMSISLIIFAIFPNGQDLRPNFEAIARNNIFLDVVKYLHSIDTCTNVFPSIHVYNSLATHIAIAHSEKLKRKTWIQIGSLILTISICLSTVFLKQHSILDGIGAVGMIAILYPIVYWRKKKQNIGLKK